MLNNKGFTIAEVLVSFTLITAILLSIIGSTVFYRDKLKMEVVKSQLVDFKNTITKVVYDDIIAGKVVRAEPCIGERNCLNLYGKDNSPHKFIVTEEFSTTGGRRGVYVNYDGNEYMLPDSDLAEMDENGNVIRICNITSGIRFSYYGSLYTIKLNFEHRDYDLKYDIILTMLDLG